MDFFGMGFGEIILVLIVAIMIWGPNKIPEIARTVGKTINTIKKTSSDLTAQITKEIEEVEDAKKEHMPPSEVIPAPRPRTLPPPPPPNPTSTNSGED